MHEWNLIIESDTQSWLIDEVKTARLSYLFLYAHFEQETRHNITDNAM